MNMQMGNGTGSIVKLSGNRRKPYAVRVTTGWEDGKQRKIDTKKAPVSIELTGFCYVENFPATNPKSVDNIEFVRQMWAVRVLHIFLICRLDILQFNPCVFQLQLAPPIFFFRDGHGQPGGNLEHRLVVGSRPSTDV